MGWWRRLALLATLLGCGRPASYLDVVDGRVDLDAGERQAVEALLAQAGRAAEDVELCLDPDVRPRQYYWLRLADGRVVGASFGEVEDLAPFADLPQLVELRVNGSFGDLADLGEHARLERLEVLSGDDRLRSLAGLARHDALAELEVAGGALGRLELPHLPALRSLSLKNVGAVALDGLPASLETAYLAYDELPDLGFLAGLDRLERLELVDCGLSDLASLPPLPGLETLILGGNPLVSVDRLADRGDFPALRRLGLRETPIYERPAALPETVEVSLAAPPGDPVDHWVASFLEARRGRPGTFIEALPRGGGTARGKKGRTDFRAVPFGGLRLRYEGTIERLEGLVWIELLEVDPALPFGANAGTVRVVATLAVEEGSARVYLREQGDLRAQAYALEGRGSEHDPTAPPVDPAERFDGYRYGEAAPGRPATIRGEAPVFGSAVVVWLEAVGGAARGVRLRLEPAGGGAEVDSP